MCMCGANGGSAASSTVNLQAEGEAFSQISARTEQRGLRGVITWNTHAVMRYCDEYAAAVIGCCLEDCLPGFPVTDRIALEGVISLLFFLCLLSPWMCLLLSFLPFNSFLCYFSSFSPAVSCFSHSFCSPSHSLPSPPLSFLLLVTLSPQSIWNP